MQKYILFLIPILAIEQTQSFNYEVMSTTERPSSKKENQNNFQQCCPGVKDTNSQLLILVLQNAQLQKRVEKLDQIEEQITNLKKKGEDDEILFQELKRNHELLQNSIEKVEKRQEESINQNNDILKKLNDIQQILHISNEQVKKQLEELTNQYNDKFKKLNELDVKLQQLEEKQTSQTTDVKKINDFKNCKEVQKDGNHDSGVYVIDLSTVRNFTVFCDMLTDGGGWTHVLTRIDGSQNFDLGWADYKKGFGDPSRNFWIGLEHLYQLTNSGDYELFVELVDWDNKTVYARYNKFKIGSEKEGYPLKIIEGYSGDAGDGLSPLIKMKFSTKDKDQDDAKSFDCANYYKGGWWHKNCYIGASKLTGIYSLNTSKTIERTAIHWMPMHQGTLQKAKMMIRPLN